MDSIAAFIVYGVLALVIIGGILKGIDDNRAAKDRKDDRKSKH